MKLLCRLFGHKWLRSKNYTLNYCLRCQRWYVKL